MVHQRSKHSSFELGKEREARSCKFCWIRDESGMSPLPGECGNGFHLRFTVISETLFCQVGIERSLKKSENRAEADKWLSEVLELRIHLMLWVTFLIMNNESV